ncbi:sensor histidine kinase [Floridanema aerugineum]|uniref:histidine kinase n=1 Tax=Floridaenema aerugineum BLCC-F46 TaxID=3153654 RepID=A0ABV4XBW2_9CYAN
MLLEYESAKDDRLKSWDNLSVDLGEESDPQFKITEKLPRAIAILRQQQQQLMTLQRLTNLLILDLSKIEAGRLDLQRQQFNLESLVREATEEVRFLAEEKHIDLQLMINLSNPIIINDSHRLKQVFMNLLSNAVKFTSFGKVEVEVFEINPLGLAIRVIDTGIGIAEEHLKNIFQEFWQVDQSFTKTHYGTGLGLAIIKSLVELMKGKVYVTSELGKGSCFQVEIPRHIPPLNYTSNCGRRLLK